MSRILHQFVTTVDGEEYAESVEIHESFDDVRQRMPEPTHGIAIGTGVSEVTWIPAHRIKSVVLSVLEAE